MAELPLWRCRKAAVVHALLDFCRDAAEMAMLGTIWALETGRDAAVPMLLHSRWEAGVFWALKWALTRCPDDSDGAIATEMIIEAQKICAHYEVFVDALKMAQHDAVGIEVDQEQRLVTVYEGGDATGADWDLVEYQHRHNLIRTQAPLTEDGDQLTAAWTAGDYRRAARWLAVVADGASGETVMYAPPGQESLPLFKRPVVVAVPVAPDPAIGAVLSDLTLTSDNVSGHGFWRKVAWVDTPLVAVGGEILGVSGMITALTGGLGSDHMLRLAAKVDPRQYSKVSGLRERRMIDICRRELEAAGWKVTPRYKLTNPAQEIDTYARREQQQLVLSLKSTLRPATPGETYNRNRDIIDGIDQAASARERLGADVTVVVVTDGYRGDFTTWRAGLDKHVAVGTLEDIQDVARRPEAAMGVLKERAGFRNESRREADLHEREFQLMGWSFRLVDAPAPAPG